MAAALIQLSFWSPERALIDPFCGIGTIPIEAARIACNIAPGLNRDFVSEQWSSIPKKLWVETRDEALSLKKPFTGDRLIGNDLDDQVLKMARYHAQQAGVESAIHFQQKTFDQIASRHEYGCVITNPPYGERIGEKNELRELYRSIPEVLRRLPTWSHFILTSFPQFESFIQKQASRRRKLYNGRIECTYYQFSGPKPKSLSKHNRPPSEEASDSTDGEPTQQQSDSMSKRENPEPSLPTLHSPRSQNDAASPRPKPPFAIDDSKAIQPVFGRPQLKIA